MRIRFWGTRGSIATPGPSTVRYGGNTACVEVRDATGRLLVLDAGTGLRELGLALERRGGGPWDADLLLSHLHWDHIQGIPFFRPAFSNASRVCIRGPRQDRPIRDILSVGMDDPFFPVDLDGLAAAFEFADIDGGGELAVGPYRIRSARLEHPSPTLGYRIEADGAVLVYATDTEDAFSGRPNPIIELAAGADVLIHDAQYLPDDYKPGWGHSTVPAAIEVALRARARRLVLTHHDPDRTDDALDRIGAAAQAMARDLAPGLDVLVAREGLELEIGRA